MRLEENLECEIHRAPALEQVHGFVEVDVVACSQDERALRVVAGPCELSVPPVLDPVVLGHIHDLEFCRRHDAALPQWVMCVTRLFVHLDVSVVPFLGGLR